MSRSWTEQELQAASNAMQVAGYMSYEEFCEELERQQVAEENTVECPKVRERCGCSQMYLCTKKSL